MHPKAHELLLSCLNLQQKQDYHLKGEFLAVGNLTGAQYVIREESFHIICLESRICYGIYPIAMDKDGLLYIPPFEDVKLAQKIVVETMESLIFKIACRGKAPGKWLEKWRN